MPERWFEYEGLIYVRPVGRGICLGDVSDDTWTNWGQLEDIMAAFATSHLASGRYARDGYAHIRIRFEVLPDA
jgi:hypothetical protein